MRPGKTLLVLAALAALSGCATVLTREPVREDGRRLSFAAAKKEFLAAARLGNVEKSGFSYATMEGKISWEVREEAVDIAFNRYLSLISQQTVPTKATCAYADIPAPTLIRYKAGGAGRSIVYGFEIPLGQACENLGVFFASEERALAFARSLQALKLRAESGPTPEELAASRPQGLSREDLATIVQAAVAGAAQPTKAAPTTLRSDVDVPSVRLPERAEDYAVVVGIGTYSDLPEARFAERDAEAVKDLLIALGYPSRNVVLLSGEKAGYKGIEKFVETWLPRNTDERSRVFFYFSGHGAPDVKTGQAYLVPWDGDAAFLENTGYPLKRLYEKLGQLKAKEVVAAIDACFSGAGGRSVLAKGARPLVSVVADAPARQTRITVLAAASSEQVTSTLEDQGHGTFTYYLLKGLGGGAKDASGSVTAKGLLDYLKPKVEDAARRQNREQNPVMQGEDRVLIRY